MLVLVIAFLQVANTPAILVFPQRLPLSLHLSIPQSYMFLSYPAAFHHQTCSNAGLINPQLPIVVVHELKVIRHFHLANPHHQTLHPIV